MEHFILQKSDWTHVSPNGTAFRANFCAFLNLLCHEDLQGSPDFGTERKSVKFYSRGHRGYAGRIRRSENESLEDSGRDGLRHQGLSSIPRENQV